jgi:hypothetical protein
MSAAVLPLVENQGLAFPGDEKRGAFEIPETRLRWFLAASNPHGKPNSDVVRPWAGAADILRGPQCKWIIDFPPGMEEREAVLYARPFAHVRRQVKPAWKERREGWWIHGTPQIAMRVALAKRDRFIAVPRVAKHLLFVWLPPETLPDCQLIVFARDDDWFFGVLHSRFHQVWALRVGTQRRRKASGFRYTPTACFETFPFPWPPATPLGKLTRTQEDQRTAIAQAARALDEQRNEWLGDRADKTHTLTALYDARPAWLQHAHAALDGAVAAAYGWPADLPVDDVIVRLLALNRDRSSQASGHGHMAWIAPG